MRYHHNVDLPQGICREEGVLPLLRVGVECFEGGMFNVTGFGP